MVPIEDIKEYGYIRIITTTQEKFDILIRDNGFIVRDLQPPIEEMIAVKLCSIEPTKGSLLTARPQDTLCYEGIHKGFHLSWILENSTELIASTGKIDSCTALIFISNLHFNLQLLEAPGRKFEWLKDNPKNFSVKTKSQRYAFKAHGTDYYFEDRKIIDILSLYKSNNILIPELFSPESTCEAISGTLYYYHPFIIFTKDSGRVKISYVTDPIIACAVLC